jgi:hypothetical protein
MENNNNNNYMDLIPFNLKDFTSTLLKSIIEYHCLFKSDSPYIIDVFDCNKNSIDRSFEIEMYFNIPLHEYDPEYDLSVQDLREDIIAACTF